MMNRWLRHMVIVLCVGSSCALLTTQVHAESRTWKYLRELSDEERRNIDPRTDTPRDATLPYLPAEPYPFTPPYTAEEMGYRAMEFPQRPRWSCVLANLFASISSSGTLMGTGQAVSYMAYPSTPGVAAEVGTPGGGVVYRYLIQNIHPPEAYGSMNLMVRW
jgi:hypothetical protein